MWREATPRPDADPILIEWHPGTDPMDAFAQASVQAYQEDLELAAPETWYLAVYPMLASPKADPVRRRLAAFPGLLEGFGTAELPADIRRDLDRAIEDRIPFNGKTDRVPRIWLQGARARARIRQALRNLEADPPETHPATRLIQNYLSLDRPCLHAERSGLADLWSQLVARGLHEIPAIAKLAPDVLAWFNP